MTCSYRLLSSDAAGKTPYTVEWRDNALNGAEKKSTKRFQRHAAGS